MMLLCFNGPLLPICLLYSRTLADWIARSGCGPGCGFDGNISFQSAVILRYPMPDRWPKIPPCVCMRGSAFSGHCAFTRHRKFPLFDRRPDAGIPPYICYGAFRFRCLPFTSVTSVTLLPYCYILFMINDNCNHPLYIYIADSYSGPIPVHPMSIY